MGVKWRHSAVLCTEVDINGTNQKEVKQEEMLIRQMFIRLNISREVRAPRASHGTGAARVKPWPQNSVLHDSLLKINSFIHCWHKQ